MIDEDYISEEGVAIQMPGVSYVHTFSVIYYNRIKKRRYRIDVACSAAGGMRI